MLPLTSTPPSFRRLTSDDVQHLGENGVVVRDGVLGSTASRSLAHAVRLLDDAGGLTVAAVGKDAVRRSDIRGDRTVWLEKCDLSITLVPLWNLFEALRETLNRDAWQGLRSFELQLACYPGDGARYQRHTDSLRGDASRRMTAIVYLNPGWQHDHGGRLLADTGAGPVIVEPLLDRLVIFKSSCVPHEVEPVFVRRFAATAWYRSSDD